MCQMLCMEKGRQEKSSTSARTPVGRGPRGPPRAFGRILGMPGRCPENGRPPIGRCAKVAGKATAMKRNRVAKVRLSTILDSFYVSPHYQCETLFIKCRTMANLQHRLTDLTTCQVSAPGPGDVSC
eukprot:jgi/Mesvir1/15292/Mv26322-RA.1